MVKSKLLYTLIAFGIIIGMGIQPAGAALQAVGPVDAVNGFPVWYQDSNGLQLGLCIDNNAFCLFDPVDNTSPFSVTIGFGAEAFWWSGEAAMAFAGGDGLLVLAAEAAFAAENPIDGDQVAFGRVRIRINVDTPGTYVVTHPFGVLTQEVLAADIGAAFEINVSDDIGNFILTGPTGDYTVMLGSSIGPFLFWDSELPQTDPGTPGAFYVGSPGVDHTVIGSPFGTNFFRIERDGVLVAETDQFGVQGKVFIDPLVGDLPPVANVDSAAVATSDSVNIDVLANDTPAAGSVPINPGSIVITNGPDGTAAAQSVNGKMMVNFTPAAGFSGDTSFSYTVASFTGNTSPAATVNVTVEDLRVDRIIFRPKFMKYRIQGTSSDVSANEISVRLPADNMNATLNGAQEVPPVTTGGSGTATISINETLTQITSSLSVQGLLNLQAAHIHVGGNGVNGPVIFNLSLTDFSSPLNNTLTAADLVPQAAQGINTFADAVNAILSGNAYINVHTSANPGGEIRGQIGPIRIIGTTQVGADGRWLIDGQLPLGLDALGTVDVRTSNAVQLNGMPVEVR